MRFDRHEPTDPADPNLQPEPESSPAEPVDAAESTWDPWLRALYLRELAVEQLPALH